MWSNVSTFCLKASRFLDPLMKNQKEEDRRAASRFFLMITIMTPLQLIFTPLSPLTREIGIPGVLIGSIITYSFIFLFAFGKMSLFALRNIILVQNIIGVCAVSKLGSEMFENTSLLESFAVYGGGFINPILGLLMWGPTGLHSFMFYWIYSFYCFFHSPMNEKNIQLMINLNLFFVLTCGFGISTIVIEADTLQKLEKALGEAVEISNLKTKFIAWLSHDLRTPLVGLTGFIHDLQEVPNLTSEQKEMASNALGCVNAISSLITHLLDFSMINSKKLVLKRELWNLSNTMHFMCALMSKPALEKNVTFQNSIDENLIQSGRLFLWGDPLRFQQVVTNLASNAIKYTPQGGRVSLIFEVDKEAQQQNDHNRISIQITVIDNGIGIPPTEVDKIFMPFYQIPRDSRSSHLLGTTQSGGAGVGLFIVSEIVKAMGGEISCSSSPRGTTFMARRLTFDLATPEELEEQSQKKSFWNEDTAGKIHILLAEDNKVNQLVLKKLIMKCGFQCSVVNNGQECVEAWKSDPHKYSLILMDLQMPVMDGFEATRQIRNSESMTPRATGSIPIVALTATTYPVELQKAIDCGMTECLSKPLTKFQLEESMFRILTTPNRVLVG